MATPEGDEDFYAILKVAPSASFADIQRSYRRLALRYHPDRNQRRSAGATVEFQRLGRAWETLRDVSSRAAYDQERHNHTWEDALESEARQAAQRARKRRQDVDREVTARWSRPPSPTAERPADPLDDIQRKQRMREWKATAAVDYSRRLDALRCSQKKLLELIQQVQAFTAYYEEVSTTDASNLKTIAALLVALKECRPGVYLQRHILELLRNTATNADNLAFQTPCMTEWRNTYNGFVEDEAQNQMLKFEEVEAAARSLRSLEASEFLGPRDVNPPLFCVIDRRGQGINQWKALSRIRTAAAYRIDISKLSTAITEGPWHRGSSWERIGGEYTCGRCGELAFNFLLECGPARCRSCGIIVCHSCHRDLTLLRDYEGWIQASKDTAGDSLFSIEIKKETPASLPGSSHPGFGYIYGLGSSRI